MNPAGYSGTPLGKKLGFKPGFRCFLLNPPDGYREAIEPLPESVMFFTRPTAPLDLVHIFIDSAKSLMMQVARLRPLLAETGMIWVSWPKKLSGVTTDVTEDLIREVAFAHDLVDVKVCAVDQTWSGLKLVIRVSLRKTSK
jgi:hypothetical protein